jgi:hypothetical protein
MGNEISLTKNKDKEEDKNRKEFNKNIKKTKDEYFKLIRKDLKETLGQINTVLDKDNIDSNINKDTWLEFIKTKFEIYFQKHKDNYDFNYIDNNYYEILFYLNTIDETKESKHIYKLGIYLKEYLEENKEKKSNKILKASSNYFVEKENVKENILEKEKEIEKENILEKEKEKEIITKEFIIWNGSEFIFEDIEKLDHPLNKFIKHLSFILSYIYEIEFEKIKNSYSLENEENQEKEEKEENEEMENEKIGIIKTKFSEIITINIDKLNVNNDNNLKSNDSRYSEFSKSSNFYKQEKELNILYDKIHKEILFFSQILTGALIRFYNIQNSCSNKILEIFNEKVKDLLLRNELYRVIYDIKTALHIKRKNIFSVNLIKYYDQMPYCISNNPYVCMDNNFRKILKKVFKKNNYTNDIKFNKEEEEEEDEENEEGEKVIEEFNAEKEKDKDIEGSGKEANINRINKFKSISKDIYENKYRIKNKNIISLPFEKTLFLLRKFNECKSMLKKIDLIFLLRESIFEEINFFWKEIPVKAKYISVDADNILSIFVYLIIKSQNANLYIDVEIMNSFLSKDIKLTRKGYFFSLIQSSVEFIIDNINEDQINENIKDYNENINKEIEIMGKTPHEILDFTYNDNLNNCNSDNRWIYDI